MIYVGEFFTFDEWKTYVDNRYLTPDDGSARWAELLQDMFINVLEGDAFTTQAPERANGVMWHNK